MNSVLFLDIDGVMVLRISGYNGTLYDHEPFDKDCVKVLNNIIDKTDCEIIISSTWKHFFDLKQMQEIFSWNGVQKTPHGFTPNYKEKSEEEEPASIKCREIIGWLSNNNTDNKFNWCATDDWDLSFALQNFVGCRDNKKGLKYKGISEKIITYLKKEK